MPATKEYVVQGVSMATGRKTFALQPPKPRPVEGKLYPLGLPKTAT